MFDDRSLDAAGHLYVPHDDKAISLRGPLPCHSFRAPYEPPPRDLSVSDVSYMSDPSRTDPSEPPDHPSRRSADSPPSSTPQRKRMRSYRQEEEEAEREPSSPSPSVASSQEGQQESSHQFAADLNPSSSQQPPPKKKRTRTLTTPQQAAELHALLAKVGSLFRSSIPSAEYTELNLLIYSRDSLPQLNVRTWDDALA